MSTGPKELDQTRTRISNALDPKSLSQLDSSLLLLQIKNAKGSSIGMVGQPQKPLSSNFVYKSIKFSLLFAVFFSLHLFNEAGCDMVSCSWQQLGSPVRLDLEPEVFPTHSLRRLKVAITKKLNTQV